MMRVHSNREAPAFRRCNNGFQPHVQVLCVKVPGLLLYLVSGARNLPRLKLAGKIAYS